ncbi:MAG: hypothetical protein K6F07_03295 [Bacilli bacterium]|nr:hypothetical protein [Bacilli bacterium]
MDGLNKKKSVNPYILVIISFAAVILTGALLLCMPWANKYGQWLWRYDTGEQVITFWDCLFTAVSATCVTGLQPFARPIGETLTFGGQLVLLVMIQIGGLGFITILTFVITLFKRKLEFRNRYFISQMVNSTNFADVIKFVRKLIVISIVCETIGTILGLPVFLQMYSNPLQAVWVSVFHSVSAFNNAGFDLFKNSLVGGVVGINGETVAHGWYVYLCVYTMLLIVVGGISFLVILEVFDRKKKPKQWRTFTKIVLTTTAILLVSGFALFVCTECFKSENRMTVLDAMFQSVTCRTAGFATYNQDYLSTAGKAISSVLMFIGGSPISTAGGIKTTTIYMIVLAMISYFSGRKTTSFKRTYSPSMVVKAMSLMFIVIVLILLAYVGVNTFGLRAGVKFSDLGLKTPYSLACAYEVFSAMGTVGLSIGIEPYLSIGSKIVLCLIMFAGRIGPITFLQIFQTNMDKKEKLHYQYVEEDFLIG